MNKNSLPVSTETNKLFIDLSKEANAFLEKLQRNKSIKEKMIAYGIGNPSTESFLETCLLYDIITVAKKIIHQNGSLYNFKSMGLILILARFKKISFNIDFDYENEAFIVDFKEGKYVVFLEKIYELANIPVPLTQTITITERQNITIKYFPIKLCLPTLLNSLDNELFSEYSILLYKIPLLLSRVGEDNLTNYEKILNEIYQLTFYPTEANEENTFTELPDFVKEKIILNQREEINETLDILLNELNSLIGLNEVKNEIFKLINFIKIQKAREKSGLKNSPTSYHLIFTGNPGTGKTTVARLVAKIYKHLGILNKGHLVETDRSGLVAEYVGHTAVKVNNIIDTAMDGILFIDEAYSLSMGGENDFGKEAISTLIKRTEDDREKIAIILAGYTKEMNDFIEINPGLKSRFNRHINFLDYNSNELIKIFQKLCKDLEYKTDKGAEQKVGILFDKAYDNRDKTFGNGRYVRNIFETILEQHANRISNLKDLDREVLTTITEDDIPEFKI